MDDRHLTLIDFFVGFGLLFHEAEHGVLLDFVGDENGVLFFLVVEKFFFADFAQVGQVGIHHLTRQVLEFFGHVGAAFIFGLFLIIFCFFFHCCCVVLCGKNCFGVNVGFAACNVIGRRFSLARSAEKTVIRFIRTAAERIFYSFSV